MKSFEELDRWIASKVRGWSARVGGGPQPKELLEIRREILEEIRDKIEPAGEGRYIFPFHEVLVRIAARDAAHAGLLDAAFSEGGSLDGDIRGLLQEAGCAIPAGFDAGVEIFEDADVGAGARPFQIECVQRKGGTREAVAATRPAARVLVLRGQAEPVELALTRDRVNIGRLQEVTGERDGLRRLNDLAFADGETTVSREHAHIRYEAATGKFRLYDDRSQRGTRIFREGRRLEAPRGSLRGVQLQHGDEIHLGDARVRFEIAADDAG